jgi:hypothetical protein
MKAALLIAMAVAIPSSALAESPYPTPKPDGTQRIQRHGTRPDGYVGIGKFCEALHRETPSAYPKIISAACPSGLLQELPMTWCQKPVSRKPARSSDETR